MKTSLAHVELAVIEAQEDATRPRFVCRVVGRATHAPFEGFNRAQAAVIEGAVVVSRLRLLPRAEVETELKRIGHDLKPFDIVLINTRAASCIGTDEYLTAGCGMGREATLYLTSRGVRVAGIDAWGWDVPFVHTLKRWLETRDPSIIWEGHKAGREIPYCHMEKLCNLEQLPPNGFTVACFPYKVKGGSAGWTRAVALFD